MTSAKLTTTAAMLAIACGGCSSDSDEANNNKRGTPVDDNAVHKADNAHKKASSGASQVSKLLGVGVRAPDFTAEAHNGKTIKMSELIGKKVVLYFYPQDLSGFEAEAFRDCVADFKKANATIIGVSIDTLETHRKFAKEFKLPFSLLSDANHEIAAAYGVPIMPGGSLHERVTFVIDEEGVIAKVFAPPVKLQEHGNKMHVDHVLDACKAIDEG